MKERKYRICTNCIMDTSDSEIKFDYNGVCSHCNDFLTNTIHEVYPNNGGAKALEALINKIKFQGEKRSYDCIIGISGGIDSSFLALKALDWGLNPLLVHVDAGWNSELAVYNIEQLVNYCNFDFHTHIVDWDEMRDVQLAYLKSGIANQDVPQDHIFYASLYKFAIKNKIKILLNGSNHNTEGIFPKSWQYSNMDSVNLMAIHKKFGKLKLKNYETISFFDHYINFPFLQGMQVYKLLNFIDYNKDKAVDELKDRVNYREYPNKHGESVFTSFFQNYYLVKRFGFDKRRPHYSSLIVSGQMTRSKALKLLNKNSLTDHEINSRIIYVCKKLGIGREEFDVIMNEPRRYYSDFKNWEWKYKLLKRVQQIFIKLKNLIA